MHHSMDFDDTCYVLNVVDDYVFDFVQDTWMKDKLSEHFNEKEPLMEWWKKDHHQDDTS